MKSVASYQIADDDLGAGLHSQVEGGEFGCILNPGVDIGLNADQKQDAFDVRVLNGHMQEIPAFVVHLNRISSSDNNITFLHPTGKHFLQLHLFSSTWLPLQDRFCCFVVLVRHGAGERSHSLTVADVEPDFWMGNE